MSGDRKEMLDQSPSDSSAPRGLNGVHGLQFGVSLVELFESPDPDEFPVEPCAEEGGGGVEQTLEWQGMNTWGRSNHP